MQVNHVSDHITHAVIGGKKSMNFGISDDPAFFQILSSALYKDPMLAMVRETICNAWDAHIDAGLNDKPISITLGDDYLTIRDYGKGIPDALIAPIYGIYGASTKKNDQKQTGGFGLGCKSPFAYTDHFEVTSCHEGIRTIYNMSKSSAELNGKPSIVPIASFPTTETGITVKIPLNPTKQNHRLGSLVKQVVYNGDIKASFNGEELPILDLDSSEHGLVLVTNSLGTHFDNRHSGDDGLIRIRYGNVIYPVENSNEYQSLYGKVVNLLRSHYHCNLIMLAPPDSISVTPSRESLTLSDLTVKTIKNLLGKFISIFLKNQEMLFRHKELINEYIDKAADEELPLVQKLPLSSWKIPGIPRGVDQKVLSTTEQFAKLEVVLRYSANSSKSLKAKKWLSAIKRYLYKVNEEALFDQGTFQSWMRTAQRHSKKLTAFGRYSHYSFTAEQVLATNWWHKKVLYPAIKMLSNVWPKFDRNSLFFGSPHLENSHYSERTPILPVRSVKINSHTQNLIHLMKTTVILAHNASSVPKRIAGLDMTTLSKHSLLGGTYFVYEISRKQSEVEEARKAFNDIIGLEIIDLTERLPHEQKAYEERRAEAAKLRAEVAAGKVPKEKLIKKVRPGLICANALLDDANKRVDTKNFSNLVDPERLKEPEIVANISTAKGHRYSLEGMDTELSYIVTKLYGARIGVTNRSDTAVKYQTEKSAMSISNYLFTQLKSDMETSPTLISHRECTFDKVDQYLDDNITWSKRSKIMGLIEVLVQNPDLNHLIPCIAPLSEEDQMRWLIWERFDQFANYDQRKKLYELKKEIENVPLKEDIKKFIDTLAENPFLDLINFSGVSAFLTTPIDDPAEQALRKKKAISLITSVLT